MSEVVHYSGKLKMVNMFINETLEEQCRRILEKHNYNKLDCYYNSWKEMLYDKLYDKYVIVDDIIYEILEKTNRTKYDGIFNSYKNSDGSIDYDIMYYDDSVCFFTEAIKKALENTR